MNSDNVFADAPSPPPASGAYEMYGAGATFPYPLIELWKTEYEKQFENVKFTYKSIGSGGGIREHTEKRVHFGASDAPLNPQEANDAQGTIIIPETIGAITISYNLPGIPSGLKLTGQMVADIYLKKITRWDDPQIAKINPELNLPSRDITVVRRSDSSGTTFVFTDYLSSVSEEWSGKYGRAKNVDWPLAVGSPGNDGVAGYVRNVPYSLGYVELAHAISNEMTYAHILNADGTKFVEPTLDTITAAAATSALSLPSADQSWYNVSIVSQPGESSYPIVSFSYFLIYKDLGVLPDMNIDKSKALIHLLYWMITDGQKYSSQLLYVPMPSEIQEIGKHGLSLVTYKGEQIYKNSEDVKKSEPKKTEKKTEKKDLKKKFKKISDNSKNQKKFQKIK